MPAPRRNVARVVAGRRLSTSLGTRWRSRTKASAMSSRTPPAPNSIRWRVRESGCGRAARAAWPKPTTSRTPPALKTTKTPAAKLSTRSAPCSPVARTRAGPTVEGFKESASPTETTSTARPSTSRACQVRWGTFPPVPPRVLILTASIGEGHDLPARTLSEQLREECPGVEVVVEDCVPVLGRTVAAVSERAPSYFFFRFSWLWDLGFWVFAERAITRRSTQRLL